MSIKELLNGKLLSCAAMLAVVMSLNACHHESEEEMYDDLYNADGRDTNMPAPGSAGEFALIAGDRVYYGFDLYNITPEYKDIISNEAQFLNTYDHKELTIFGHCDKRGTQEYNLALGMRRANSHKNALVAHGVDPTRIKTISYGKERPLVEGDSERAYAQNRVTIVNLD